MICPPKVNCESSQAKGPDSDDTLKSSTAAPTKQPYHKGNLSGQWTEARLGHSMWRQAVQLSFFISFLGNRPLCLLKNAITFSFLFPGKSRVVRPCGFFCFLRRFYGILYPVRKFTTERCSLWKIRIFSPNS